MIQKYAVFETAIPNSSLLGILYLGTVEAFSLGSAYMLAHREYPGSPFIEVSELVRPWTGIEN